MIPVTSHELINPQKEYCRLAEQIWVGTPLGLGGDQIVLGT